VQNERGVNSFSAAQSNINRRHLSLYEVKEAVFSFDKFLEVDPILGPEMRSTGEFIGIDRYFPLAFLKAEEGAGFHLRRKGRVFVSVPDEDKPKIIPTVEKLERLGFRLVATDFLTACPALRPFLQPVLRSMRSKRAKNPPPPSSASRIFIPVNPK